LKNTEFTSINVVSAFDSHISEWGQFELDVTNGKILKPNSLFIEAYK
jgi:hypothetical protein